MSTNNLNEYINQLSYTIEELEKRIATIKKNSVSEDYLSASLTELNTDVNTIKTNLTQLQSNYTVLNATVTSNSNAITQIQNNLTDNAVIQQINSDITTINNTLTSLSSSVVTNTNDISSIQSSINTINNSINSINSSITSLNQQIQNAGSGNTAQLQSSISSLQTNVTNLTNRVTTLETGMSGNQTTNPNNVYSRIYNCFNYHSYGEKRQGKTCLYYPLYLISLANSPLKIKISATLTLSQSISETNTFWLELNQNGTKLCQKSLNSNQTTLLIDEELNIFPNDISTTLELCFEHNSSAITCQLTDIKLELHGVNCACINKDESIKFTAQNDVYMCAKQTTNGTIYQIKPRAEFDYTNSSLYETLPSITIDRVYGSTNNAIMSLSRSYCPLTSLFYNHANSFATAYYSNQNLTTKKRYYLFYAKNQMSNVNNFKNSYLLTKCDLGLSVYPNTVNDAWGVLALNSAGFNTINVRYNSVNAATFTGNTVNDNTTINHRNIANITCIDTTNSNINGQPTIAVLTLKNGENYVMYGQSYNNLIYIGFGWNIHIEFTGQYLYIYKQIFDHIEKITLKYGANATLSYYSTETINNMCEYLPLNSGDYLYKTQPNSDYILHMESTTPTNQFVIQTINNVVTLVKYDGTLSGDVTLPSTNSSGNLIEQIAPMAFANQTNVTKFTVPSSIQKIGAYCFYNCTSLTEVAFDGTNPNNTNLALGKNIFKNTAITSFTVPSHCNNIGEAFFNNHTIQSITFTPNTINNHLYIYGTNIDYNSYRSLYAALQTMTTKKTAYYTYNNSYFTADEISGLSAKNWKYNLTTTPQD